MNNFITATLYGASIARMDNGTYASLFIGQHVQNEEEENAKGITIMKLACDPKVYDTLNISAYPAEVRLEIKLVKASGGKLGQRCVRLVPESEIAKPAQAKSA